MKLFRRTRNSAAPAIVPPTPTPEQEAKWAGEDAAYGIATAASLDAFGLMKALVLHRHRPIAATLHSVGKRHSMLHRDVLTLLYFLARKTKGDILEIGAYVGGSTIAEAYGMRASGRSRAVVTVENGGKFDHPKVPSSDIVADLKKNLAAHGVSDLVQVVVGLAAKEETKAKVRAHLCAQSVGLFVMDADGAVRTALEGYRDLLMDGCWMVIDDYYAPEGMAKEKGARTREEVDALVAGGGLETLGCYGWGTWIGRWSGGQTKQPVT
jgi:predicted O-methyltransferase YrrM